MSTSVVARVRQHGCVALAWVGAALTVVGLVLAASGRVIEWEAFGISAQNAMRVVSEGLFALLAAAALRWNRCDRRTAVAIALLLAAFHASLAGASRPQRVGDGHEYIAMARQLSTGSLPAIPVDELEARRAEIAGQSGYDDVDLRVPSLVGRDERQDFVHFWLYPLIAAPWLGLASLVHVHWNVAFVAVNVILLAWLAWLALRALPVGIVLVLGAGPVIWWVDKAQVEVFDFALCGLALLLLRTNPGSAPILLGVLSAQNPAFVVLLCPAVLWSVAAARNRHDRWHALLWAGGALLVASLGPIYYVWHLGRVSPLADAVSFSFPTITALLTPLVDPLCGFIWYVPGLLVLVALALPAAAKAWPDRDVVLAAWGTAALLVVFALSANVNHGGTPGPSRYGVWLLPLAIPLLIRLDVSTPARELLVAVVALCTMTHAMLAFHPRLPQGSAEPPRGAAWMMEHWPSLYDPLPEVFAERYGGTDGAVTLPIASTGCGKVLLAGDGHGAPAWPIPCVPIAAPPECTREWALCYASRVARGRYVFSPAPRQPGFEYRLSDDLTWRDARELAWLPVQPQWDRLQRVTPFTPGSLMRRTRDVTRVRAFQDGRELLAFFDVRQDGAPVLELAEASTADVWVITRASRRARRADAVRADAVIRLPTRGRESMVLIRPKG